MSHPINKQGVSATPIFSFARQSPHVSSHNQQVVSDNIVFSLVDGFIMESSHGLTGGE